MVKRCDARRSAMIHSPGWERTKAELEVERGSGNVGYLAEAGRRRGRWTVARAHRIRARLALGISLAPLSHRISCRLRNARRLVPLPNCLLSLPRHFHFPSSVFQEARLPLESEPPFSRIISDVYFLKTLAHCESVTQPIERILLNYFYLIYSI